LVAGELGEGTLGRPRHHTRAAVAGVEDKADADHCWHERFDDGCDNDSPHRFTLIALIGCGSFGSFDPLCASRSSMR
jgi:hypothetical protein